MQAMGELTMSTRRRSSMVARLASLPLAVILWLLTMGGLALHQQATAELRLNLERTFDAGLPMGWTLGATALLVVAALLWAVLTAWSSVGTVVVGVATVAFGVAMSSREVFIWVLELTNGLDWSVRQLLPAMLTPEHLTFLGSMLLAVGLGASLARRRR